MKLHKSLYIGLSALMIASIGGLSQSNNVNAKRRTKVVRITHLKKWQRNKLNHAKYVQAKNNRKIKSFKKYLKHHKHGKYVLQYRFNISRLTKQNKKLNHQIYQYNHKKATISKHYKKHNTKHFVRKHNHITNAQRKINAVKRHEHFMHEQIAQQISNEQQGNRDVVNNDLGGTQQNNLPKPSSNADSIYQKAYNDTEPQYQQATNNLQQANQNTYDLTTGE